MLQCLWPDSRKYFCWKWVIALFLMGQGCGYVSCRCLALLCSSIQTRPQRTGYMNSVQNNSTPPIKLCRSRLRLLKPRQKNYLCNSEFNRSRKLTRTVRPWFWLKEQLSVHRKQCLRLSSAVFTKSTDQSLKWQQCFVSQNSDCTDSIVVQSLTGV